MYGGCLPLLLQMPLFFAYYRVLLECGGTAAGALVLAHRSFLPDPLHILPILIIVHACSWCSSSRLRRAWIPTQRRMMAIMMPAIMGFTLWHFAFGPGALLGHRQHHQPRHAGGHQPVEDRQGDARDRRATRRKKKGGGHQQPAVDPGPTLAVPEFQRVPIL